MGTKQVLHHIPSVISTSPVFDLFGVGPFPQQLTIGVLYDDILLDIFRHYLDATPHSWPTLVWVCQRWREIVLASPLGLNLRLYCRPGTPFLKALCHWPALPIAIHCGGTPDLDPPAPEDDDNIIAALKQSDRVRSIRLTITSSLCDKLSLISEPFTQLKDVVLFSQDNLQLTFPSSFHLGPHLRTLCLIRIIIPSFLRLLSPSQCLVDIRVHEIPIAGYFSPEALANALSGMTQVRFLSLHFRSPHRNHLGLPPPPGERVVLPALVCLHYQGTSMYLNSFVARIDAPRLTKMNVTFCYQPTMDASQLGQFIQRTEIHALLFYAEVETSANAISLSLTDSIAPTPFRLQIWCHQLDRQLSCMAQVCDQVSPSLSHVIVLWLKALHGYGDPNGDSEQWLDLLHSFKFSGAQDFWITGKELTADILCALGPANEWNTTMLPSLRQLHVQEPIEMDGSSWDSVQSFVTSRSISGIPVEVMALSYQCHICHGSFKEQLGLKRHLRDKHGYQILCSHCDDDFECTLEHVDPFREHLKSKHPEIAHKVEDALISRPSLTSSQPDNLVNQHSSLRAPVITSSSSTSTALRQY